MNTHVYLFGCLGNGYTQYPDDYARDIHQKFYEKSVSQTQIAIHRDGNLMYYGYIRKLDDNSRYIGICVLLNDVMFSNVGALFPIFENAFADLVTHGEILQFTDKGEIITKVDNLFDKQQEIDRISALMQDDIEESVAFLQKLPPLSYAIANYESKTFSVSDSDEDIVEASCKYGYTFVLKDEDYESAALTSSKNIILRLNSEKNKISSDFAVLKKDYDKLAEQKKQYKKVVILCFVLALCGVGLCFLVFSLNRTHSNLRDAEMDLSQREETIDELDEEVDNLSVSLKSERERTASLESQLRELKSNYENYMPIIITDVDIANVYNDGRIETDYDNSIYSNRSMYLKPKITYTGVKTDEDVTINVRLYTPSGTFSRGSSSPSYCSYSESFSVYSGSNSYYFQGWGGSSMGHWSSGTYRFEFWYGSVCLMSKSFTLY